MCRSGHEHRGALHLARAQALQGLIGIFEQEGLRDGVQIDAADKFEKGGAVFPRQVGDGADLPF